MPRVMEIVTPLGEDVLLFHGMHGREELSRVSEYQFDLLSTRNDIDVDEILGKNVTMKLALPDDATRSFNGFVTRFSQHGTVGRYHRYAATVRPWLWFLTRTADCRIFQAMTVPEIVQAVFSDHSTADFALELTGSYRTWDYCVQYRETDFNFVSRLLEQEGIYYYFRHTDGHNTLVLTDSPSQHVGFPGYEELPFIAPGRLARPEREHVSSWEFSREIQPGAYVHDDYDLERPSVELRTQRTLPRHYEPSTYEVYDYPGEYLQTSDGEQYASVRIEEFGAQFEAAHAATNARGVGVGYSLTITDHPRADQNREYLVVAASYDLAYSGYEGMPQASGGGAQFRCGFSAMSTAEQFRPSRITPKPFVQGPQTAMVVGPSGDEIYTDDFGRVKVQFHWDRRGTNDENSSCWIRVSHPWAGKGWGSVATPRIGQEVIVDFLEGDPDQPIITGRVYNAECQPPFGFPAGAVTSGFKSQTHKGGGYNEISADDTAGKERVTIHGQYDMNTTVEHNQTNTIHNNRTTAVDVNDTETIGSDQTISVGANQKLTVGADQTNSIGASQVTTVGASQSVVVGADQSVQVGANQTGVVAANQSVTVGSNQDVQVGAAQTIVVGAAQNTTVGAGRAVAVSAGDELSVGGAQKIHAGGAINIDSGGKIMLTAGGSSVEIGPGGVKIQSSGTVVITGGGTVTLKGAVVKVNS